MAYLQGTRAIRRADGLLDLLREKADELPAVGFGKALPQVFQHLMAAEREESLLGHEHLRW
jgi:hypothetical protein